MHREKGRPFRRTHTAERFGSDRQRGEVLFEKLFTGHDGFPQECFRLVSKAPLCSPCQVASLIRDAEFPTCADV